MIEILTLISLIIGVKKSLDASVERRREIALQEALVRDVAALKEHAGLTRRAPGTEVSGDYRRFL